MNIKSNLCPRDYNAKDVVRVIIKKQQDLYIKNRCYPIDIYVSTNPETNDDVLVMIFLKNETKELYAKWKNFELV